MCIGSAIMVKDGRIGILERLLRVEWIFSKETRYKIISGRASCDRLSHGMSLSRRHDMAEIRFFANTVDMSLLVNTDAHPSLRFPYDYISSGLKPLSYVPPSDITASVPVYHLCSQVTILDRLNKFCSSSCV